MVVLAAMDQPSSVPTSDISAHPTMFEIDMRSSVPDQDYITNVSVTHDSAEQAGKFTASTAGLTTNLDTLLDDSPSAITVICKFKNNADNSTGILFHIGNISAQYQAFGIHINYSQNLLYLYTWANDHTYDLNNLYLGTQWNEIVAIYDNSTTGNNKLQLYLNGVKQTHNRVASNATINLTNNKNLYVGQRHNSAYWSGYMKHIKIFPKVVYGLIKIKVKLTLKPIENIFEPGNLHAEDSFSYDAENYPSMLSDMTTFLQDVYFKYQLKDGVTPSNSIGMFVDFKINGNSTNPNDNVQYNAYRYFSTSGEGQGTIYNNQNSIENNDFKIRIGGSSDNYDKNNTYAILTFHRELIEKDIKTISRGSTFETLSGFKKNLYHRHIFDTPDANSDKTTFVFEEFVLNQYPIRFSDRVILKYKNKFGQDTWVQFGRNNNKIHHITYDNEDDAYAFTNQSDATELSGNTYSINVDVDDRNIEMILLAGNNYNYLYTSTTNTLKVVQYNETFSTDLPSIKPVVQNLTNTINLTKFVENSTIYNWSEYKIKFTYYPTSNTSTEYTEVFDTINDTNNEFILDMLLKQLEEDVTCKFDILKSDDSVVHTSSNFTLLNQNVTASNFELSLLSSAVTSSILFQNNSQWIYMHDSGLNQAFIHYKADVISQTNVDYHPFFMHGDTYSSESQQLDNSDTQKIKLKLTLNNNKISGDTISFTDTTEFIIHKVDFGAFHTPIINPRSNINYFKEKTFRFTVSNNFYSFKFPNNNSGITYTTKDIINSDTQIIDSSDKSSFPKPIVVTNPSTAVIDVNIMDYLFTNGDNNLKFTIKNTLNGATSIYNTTDIIQQEITSIPETITLNVESDAIISCTPS